MDNCYHRSEIYLGSTSTDAPYISLGGYAATNPEANPLSYNWNTVFVRYCSGGSFITDLEPPIIYNDTKLYFRGFRILNAALQFITDEYGFGSATDVLITGGSAGGLTVGQHANYIQKMYVSSTANYMAMVSFVIYCIRMMHKYIRYFVLQLLIYIKPDSGFFLDFEGNGGFIEGWKWKYDYQNLTTYLNYGQPECVDEYTKNGGDIMECVFAQNIAKFVKVKMFALQGRYDSWQLTHELCLQNNATASNGYGYI